MKINLVNLIDISLVLLLSYIIIFRGNMPEYCFKGFIIGIVSYHFISKYYSIEKYHINMIIPENLTFLGNMINGKSFYKVKKAEKFLAKKTRSLSLREPDFLTESISDF
jgi:hypothetical protein